MPGITPEQWERDGFVCTCEIHLEAFQQEDDVVSDDCPCDDPCMMDGCTDEAVYEIYPDMKSDLKEAAQQIKEGKTVPFDEVKDKYGTDKENKS